MHPNIEESKQWKGIKNTLAIPVAANNVYKVPLPVGCSNKEASTIHIIVTSKSDMGINVKIIDFNLYLFIDFFHNNVYTFYQNHMDKDHFYLS